MSDPLFAWFGLGPQEMIIVGIVAVLLFGKRLPEVGRNLGKSFVEFKRGISGVQDEISNAGSSVASSVESYHDIDDQEEATAPKFEPPKSEPQPEAAADESVKA